MGGRSGGGELVKSKFILPWKKNFLGDPVLNKKIKKNERDEIQRKNYFESCTITKIKILIER